MMNNYNWILYVMDELSTWIMYTMDEQVPELCTLELSEIAEQL